MNPIKQFMPKQPKLETEPVPLDQKAIDAQLEKDRLRRGPLTNKTLLTLPPLMSQLSGSGRRATLLGG